MMTQEKKEMLQARKAMARKEGLCTNCGKALPEGDTHSECPACREKRSKTAKARRAERRKVRILAEGQNVLGAEALSRMTTLEAKVDLVISQLKRIYTDTVK